MASKSTTDVLTELEGLITCAICLDTFNDARSLSCLHSFCLSCIRQVFNRTSTRDNILVCPTCRTGTVITDGKVESLPRCFQVEKIKTLVSDHATDGPVVSAPDHTLCSYDDNNRAVSYCFVCTRTLCATCKTHHDGRPGFDQHFQVLASDGLLKSLVCKKHGKLLEAYCTECWEPVCRLCHIESHTGGRHNVHDFCEHTEETHHIASQLQREQNSLQTTLDEVDTLDKEFDDHIDDIHAEITMRKNALIQQIEEQERMARDELDKNRETIKDSLHDTRANVVVSLTGLERAHSMFLNITQPLPQAPSVTIVNASAYLDDITATLDQVRVHVTGTPRYKFKVGKGDVSLGTVIQDKTRQKTATAIAAKPRSNSRASNGEGSEKLQCPITKAPVGSLPKTNSFLNQLFGGSRTTVAAPEQKWCIGTPGTVENICCSSQGNIIVFMQDPPRICIYNDKGVKQDVPPDISCIHNSWRAAIYSSTSMLALIRRPESTKPKYFGAQSKPESTVMLYSMAANIVMNTFTVQGVAAAIAFTRFEDIIVGTNEPTTALYRYDSDGTLQWESKIKYSCQRIVVDREDRIIVLSTSLVHIHDQSGQEMSSFPTGHDAHILQAPRGVYADYQGGILVADQTKQKVVLFTSSGAYVRDILRMAGTPRDITMYKDRYLIVGTFDKQLFMYELAP